MTKTIAKHGPAPAREDIEVLYKDLLAKTNALEAERDEWKDKHIKMLAIAQELMPPARSYLRVIRKLVNLVPGVDNRAAQIGYKLEKTLHSLNDQLDRQVARHNRPRPLNQHQTGSPTP